MLIFRSCWIVTLTLKVCKVFGKPAFLCKQRQWLWMSGDFERGSELRMRRARPSFEEEHEREQSGTMREE